MPGSEPPLFFEAGVWLSWGNAFELSGNSYTVTGQLIVDQDRILAWSLGVPAVLFALTLACNRMQVQPRPLWQTGGLFLLLALLAPFSTGGALILLLMVSALLFRQNTLGAIGIAAPAAVVSCLILSWALALLHPGLGGGPEGELVRGELLRTILDLLSLVLPAWLLLAGVLKLSKGKKDLS